MSDDPKPVELPCGKIPDEPIIDYHAAQAWSKSKLDLFIKRPLEAFRKYIKKDLPVSPPSQAMLEGQAFAAFMEGEESYLKQVVIMPKDAPKDLRRFRNAKNPSLETLDSCDFWDDFDKMAAGRMVISADVDKQNREMRESVMRNRLGRLIFESGQAETTFRAQTSLYYIQCRTDWHNEEGASLALVDELRKHEIHMEEGEPYAADLKAVGSLVDHWGSFESHFTKLGYYRQGPFYRSVMKSAANLSIGRFLFVAVERSPMASVTTFAPDLDSDKVGWNEICEAVEKLSRCYQTGDWPDVPDFKTARLAKWFLHQKGLA